MTASVQVASAWKNVESISVRVGGDWKEVAEGYVRVGGDWKEFFSANPGWVLLTPLSTDNTAGTATINANGSVTFSAIESLSLNGVFTADFMNYVVVIRHTISPSNQTVSYRLRASGSDATGSNYETQQLAGDAGVLSAARTTGTSAFFSSSSTNLSGDVINFHKPALATETFFRNYGGSGVANGTMRDNAVIHSLSTAYDGFTFFPPATFTLSGLVRVYGIRGA